MKKEKVRAKKNEKQVLSGVKIISILFYIIAIFSFFQGILLFFVAAGLINNADLNKLLISTSKPFLSVIALFMIVFGIFLIVTAMNLKKMKNWARISAVVISLLGILSSVNSILSYNLGLIIEGVTMLIINLLVVFYLFNKKVKEAFK